MNVFEKIEAQQAKLKDTEPAWMVGEQLKDICRADPGCAEIVSQDLENESMSIVAAADKIKEYADKQPRIGNCVCVSPRRAELIIREFYGISGLFGHSDEKNSAGPSSAIDLLDLSALLV